MKIKVTPNTGFKSQHIEKLIKLSENNQECMWPSNEDEKKERKNLHVL